MVLIASPWCFKPFYGLVSDAFPIYDWGNRRPYISIFLYLASFMYVFMNVGEQTKQGFVLMLLMLSWFVCYADVCADSIMVNLTKKETVIGNIQSICWSARAMGALAGALFGGMAYSYLGGINVFRICAIMPFITSILIWKLPKIQMNTRNLDVISKLIDNVKEQKYLAILLLIFNIAPSYGEFYVYFLQEELKYTPQQFAWLRVSASLTFLLSTITFNRFLINKPGGTVILIGLMGTFLCQMAQLLVVFNIYPYFLVVLLDGVAESFFGTLILMPLIVMVAKGCKDGVEGSLYSLMMAISNLSGVMGNWLGTLIGYSLSISRTNFNNIGWFIILCFRF